MNDKEKQAYKDGMEAALRSVEQTLSEVRAMLPSLLSSLDTTQ